MDHRSLGTTGILVSPIGFGAFKIGRNRGIKYPTGYALPDEDDASRLLNSVVDMGINLIPLQKLKLIVLANFLFTCTQV